MCYGDRWCLNDVRGVNCCERCGNDVWIFARRFSGVVGICGPKMWFCRIALCHHGRFSLATWMLSCSIGQSACGMLNG